MKISVENGILDLPKGFALTMEYHHPFYSDGGAASIPATIPSSAENLSLLGWPNKVNQAKRYIKEQMAFVEAGTYNKQCLLIIDSLGKDGISMSLAMRESELYAQNQEKKLKDVLANYGYFPTKSSMGDPYSMYTGQYRQSNHFLSALALFPVASDLKKNENGASTIFVINEVSGSTIVDSPRSVAIGDSMVTVPAGYGVAPYLYLWKCVQYVFESLGYSVRTNALKDDIWLKDVVLLHDMADCCCQSEYSSGSNFGQIYYSDLVPDITVGDLIVWLHDKFGIIVTYDAGYVDIRFFEPMAAKSNPDVDLTSYVKSVPEISYPDAQGLSLSVETSIDGAAPAAESIEDLRTLYTNCADIATVDKIQGTGLFFVTTLGKYYYSDVRGSSALLGSDAYKYKRRLAKKDVEISAADNFVPMINYNGNLMPYIGERSHKYVEAGTAAPEQEIKICYAHFSGTYHGSTNTYNKDGSKFYPVIDTGKPPYPLGPAYPSLIPEDIKKNWWSTHEKTLLNSSPEVTVEMDLPVAVVLSTDWATPKLYDGSRVIVKDMAYNISDSAITTVKATLQVLPMYDDMIVGSPVIFGHNYIWKLESTRSIYDGNGYTVLETDGLSDYAIIDAPKYQPTSIGVKAKIRKRWLKYKYSKKVVKWWGITWQKYTSTHVWEEYFISENQ